MSMPRASKRVATVWRSRGGERRFLIPAVTETARTTWPTRWRVSTCGVGPEPCWRLAKSGPARREPPEQLRQLTPDRHLPPLIAFAMADGDHALRQADVLDF